MSITLLSVAALIFVIVEYIVAIFPDAPLILHYIVQLSSAVVFFCAVEWFLYTNNKKRFLVRLYVLNLLMTCVDLVLPRLLPVQDKLQYIPNNVFFEIFFMMTLVYIWDRWTKDKKKLVLGTVLFVVYQIIGNIILSRWLGEAGAVQSTLVYSVTGVFNEYFMGFRSPTVPLYLDCLIPIFYLFRKREGDKDYRRPAIAFVVWWAVYVVFAILLPTTISQDLPVHIFIERIGHGFVDRVCKYCYQWLVIFALPLLLCYNGKKKRV